MGKVSSFYIIIFLILCGCFGCSRQPDERLRHVDSILSRTPKEALASLDSIDRKSLGGADQHYYDFLTIKGHDKAYIKHTGDSLYLSVLDYYSKHRGDTLYPEVLYYGGRVYSDLGDYPTALLYFQKSLDLLPEDTKQLELKSHVLNQTARIFISLRLYERAIPYIENAIKIDSLTKDSLDLIFDTQMLGSVNMHLKNFHDAEKLFIKARNLAERISPIDVDQLDVFLASVKSKTNKLDSAKILIQTVLDKDTLVDRDNALAYGTDIFYKSQIYDTAFMFAHEIIQNNSSNRKFALHYMLSPNLIKYIPSDSLNYYITDFLEIIEKESNKNKDNEALLQNVYYNYQLHDREREKIFKEKAQIKNILIGVIFIVLILIILVLKRPNSLNKLKPHGALAKFGLMRESSDSNVRDTVPETVKNTSADKEILSGTDLNFARLNDLDDKSILINSIREELLAIQQNNCVSKTVNPEIISSEAYATLMRYIDSQQIINDENPLWKELEKAVTSCSKDFKRKLQLLAEGNLKQEDLQLALLIKCGISPTKISRLVGRGKSSITYRKETLCTKILRQKLSSNTFDDIIHLL